MRGRGSPPAEGDRERDQRHVPVLLPQVLAGAGAAGRRTFIDGTFGAGGYTERS